MAFQLAVTKKVPYQSDPLSYPNAYWVPSFEKIDHVAQTAWLRFLAYADKATRELGTIDPVDFHIFRVSGLEFATYFSPASTASVSIYEQAYAMALATPDNPQADVPVIFFAQATNV